MIKLEAYKSWAYLGYKDIIMRYRRTVLGPLWLVFGTAIIVTAMSFVSSVLFKSNIIDSLVYVSSGIVTWLFLSTLISNSSYIFISQAGLLKNIPVDISLLCFRYFSRDFIAFLHNVAFIILLNFIFKNYINIWFFLFIPWSLIFLINFIFLCYSLGFLSARFRDVPQVVTALITVSSFVTPILWKVDALGDKAVYIYMNPLVHFLDLMRNALMCHPPLLANIYGVVIITFFNGILYLICKKKFSKKLRFWL